MIENKFKIGDKVRLSDFHEHLSHSTSSIWEPIKFGDAYNICDVDEFYIYLEETKPYGKGGFYYENFTLV